MEQKTEIIEVPVTEKWTIKPGRGTVDVLISGPVNGFVDSDGRGVSFGHVSEIPEQVWKRAEELYREGQPVSGEVIVEEHRTSLIGGNNELCISGANRDLWEALRPGRVKITVERLD